MPTDRARHLSPLGVAAEPPAVASLRTALAEEFRRAGMKHFREGYSTAVDQLADPAATTWLADKAGLPEDHCRALLLELRGMLVAASGRG